MQWMLEDQLSQAKEFVSQYQTFTESRQLSEYMGKIITTFEHDISCQIDKMEQGIRDLLQVVSGYFLPLCGGPEDLIVTRYCAGICVGVNQRSSPVD